METLATPKATVSTANNNPRSASNYLPRGLITRASTLDTHAEKLAELKRFREASIQREAAQRQDEQIARFTAQIPFCYRDKTFADFRIDYPKQQLIKKIVERFVATFAQRIGESGANLWFFGNHGTGKTLLAYLMAQALVRAGYHVKYISTLDFLKSLLDCKFKFNERYPQELKTYTTPDFLILDEVTESVNKDGMLPEVERQVLRTIIDERYRHARSTLVITNRTTQDISACLGQAIMDRLSEYKLALVFNWPSYRQR